jgi:hypothetical protein
MMPSAIKVYNDSGELLNVIVQTRSPGGMRRDDVEAAIRDAVSEHTIPAFRERMRAALEDMPRPSSFPAYESLHVDREHHV